MSERNKIIQSLKEKHYQSVRQLCANTGLSDEIVAAVVEYDDEIDYNFFESNTVYFLTANPPKRKPGETVKFYNTGDNCFAVRDAEESVKTAAIPKPEEPLPSKAAIVTDVIETLSEMSDEEIAEVGQISQAEKPAERTKRFIEITEQQIEDAAVIGGTQAKTAKELKVDLKTLIRRLGTPNLKAAFDRGKNKFYESNPKPTKSAAKPAVRKTQSKSPERDKITVEKLEQCAFEGLSLKQTAESIGVTYGLLNFTIYSTKEDRKYNDAWKLGKKRRKEAGGEAPKSPPPTRSYKNIPVTPEEDEAFNQIPSKTIGEELTIDDVETDSRFENTINHLSEHGRSAEGFEAKKAELVEKANAAEAAPFEHTPNQIEDYQNNREKIEEVKTEIFKPVSPPPISIYGHRKSVRKRRGSKHKSHDNNSALRRQKDRHRFGREHLCGEQNGARFYQQPCGYGAGI